MNTAVWERKSASRRRGEGAAVTQQQQQRPQAAIIPAACAGARCLLVPSLPSTAAAALTLEPNDIAAPDGRDLAVGETVILLTLPLHRY